MKKTQTLLVALGAAILVLGSDAALAQFKPPAEPDRMSFYLGGSLGRTQAKEDVCNIGNGIACDRLDQNFGIQMGLMFNKFFGTELGFRSLGKVVELNDGAGMTAEVKSRAFEALGVALLPVDRLSIYAKGGPYVARSKLTSSFLTEGTSTTKQWTYGFGVGWDFTRHLTVRLEWQRYNNLGGTNVGFRTDVETTSLGAIWRF